MRSEEEILESIRKNLQEGERDGSVHFNPPGPDYLKDLLPEKEESPAKSAEETSTSEESTPRRGLTERVMINRGIPVTRTNWLRMNYPFGLPEEWSQELENELPEALQREDWDVWWEEQSTAQ